MCLAKKEPGYWNCPNWLNLMDTLSALISDQFRDRYILTWLLDVSWKKNKKLLRVSISDSSWDLSDSHLICGIWSHQKFIFILMTRMSVKGTFVTRHDKNLTLKQFYLRCTTSPNLKKMFHSDFGIMWQISKFVDEKQNHIWPFQKTWYEYRAFVPGLALLTAIVSKCPWTIQPFTCSHIVNRSESAKSSKRNIYSKTSSSLRRLALGLQSVSLC